MKCGTPAGSSLGGRSGAGRAAGRGLRAGRARAGSPVSTCWCSFPQPGPGLGAELLDEDLAGALIGGERLGLPSVTVEGEHELGVQAFPERMHGRPGAAAR